MSFDEILRQLPKLTAAQLTELRQRAAALLAVSGVSEEMATDDWLLQGVLRELDDRGLSGTVPMYFKISNGRQYYGYRGKAKKVRETFEGALVLTRSEQVVLGRLLARSLAEYIERFRPVNLNAMLQHADLVLPAFEDAFPGYLKSGLVPVLLRGFHRAA